MPRPLRLTSSRDFARIFRVGTRGSSALITCVVTPGDPSVPARVGLTVGRGVGNAVKRNRARRLLREAVRATCIKAGSDVVLVAKPPLAQSSLADVRAALDTALERAGASC
jgi:ribonuclease P protein component